jgi:hypothetical protein
VVYLDSAAGSVEHEGMLFPLIDRRPKRVKNLPPARPGILIIVSRLVAEAAPERLDLVVPNDLIQDRNRRVVGCRSLAHLS